MNFSLKPRVFLIGFLPGFLFILACVILFKNYDLQAVRKFAEHISLFSGITIVIMSFIIGQIFDSFRDFFIDTLLFNWLCKTRLYKKYLKNGNVNWDFFYDASENEIDKLDNNYYLFYVVNINLSICLVVISAFIIFNWPQEIPKAFLIDKFWLLITIFGSMLLLVLDALILRDDVAKITKCKQILNDKEKQNVTP